MLRIMSMHVETFLSFGEADFDFADAGLVLVEGDNRDDDSARSNGSGKSAMIDALVWCLFGTTLRGYQHDDVVNRRSGDAGCVVTTYLSSGAEKWAVTRARRHKKLKNTLTVEDASGVGFVYASDKDAQAEVERRLGCSERTFLSSVVFGQDRAYRFSSLTDGEQKKILDEVLGVERFADACTAARKATAAAGAELETARRELKAVEHLRGELEEEIGDLDAKHTSFEEAQASKVEAEREKLARWKAQLGKTRKFPNIPVLKLAAEVALKALAASEKRSEKWVGVDAEARAAVAGSKTKLDLTVAELRRRRAAPGKCPTCGQKVAGKVGTDAVAELRDEVEKLQVANAGWVKIAEEAAATMTSCRAELKAARQAMADAQNAWNAGVALEADASSLRRRRADCEERIAELEGEVSPYAELAGAARVKHARYEKEAKALAVDVAVHEVDLKRAQFWVQAFGAAGLRSLLLDTSLPILNEEASRVSRAVTGGSISIEFSATSEQKSGKVVDRFEVRVDNRHGAGTYEGNSAGERAKVDLCVGLALQRLVASRSTASFNIAFYDEVFDHLDSAAHERVVGVLSDLDKESVFVVSHDDDLKAWFQATLRVVKEGGMSRVET